MNYKLAKKLKDAGYPQGVGQYIGEDWQGGGDEESLRKESLVGAYIPTLSELIESCGVLFGALSKNGGNNWSAIGHKIGVGMIHLNGLFPEEAVANLWIAVFKENGKSK